MAAEDPAENAAGDRTGDHAEDRADAPADAPADEDRDWIPMDQNPHADDKRDVLDPSGEETPFKRLIYIGLGIGVLVVALVIWLL